MPTSYAYPRLATWSIFHEYSRIFAESALGAMRLAIHVCVKLSLFKEQRAAAFLFLFVVMSLELRHLNVSEK